MGSSILVAPFSKSATSLDAGAMVTCPGARSRRLRNYTATLYYMHDSALQNYKNLDELGVVKTSRGGEEFSLHRGRASPLFLLGDSLLNNEPSPRPPRGPPSPIPIFQLPGLPFGQPEKNCGRPSHIKSVDANLSFSPFPQVHESKVPPTPQ